MPDLPHDPALQRTLALVRKENEALSHEDRLAYLADVVAELQTLLEDELAL